jgi:hypothetical protein
MALSYNRSAFRAPIVKPGDPFPPLVGTYITLVAIEIFLKDHLLKYVPKVPATHDVPKMLKTLSTYLGPRYSGAITSMAAQLSTRLANIYCQGKDGGSTKVPSSSYPYIRYVRHSDDWDSCASSDDEINSIFVISSQIIHTLFKATGEKI